ncbi:MAG: hypothetical protein KKH28_03430 [Elusimicrobia bacterium]|nr:hypothetical protein [Elusimicrobiota bacterium]
MKILLCIGLTLLFAGQALSYVSVDCDVNVQVNNRINRLDVNQQIGAERIECTAAEARVVRIVKTAVEVQAYADADSRGNASARYSDSCSCSCGQGAASSCNTSGRGSDYCSDSDSDSVSRSETAETKFTVARSPLDLLREMGFTVRQDADYCRLIDAGGVPLNILRAVAVITLAYGNELIKETVDYKSLKKLQTPGQPALPSRDDTCDKLLKTVTFDGKGGLLK